MDEQPHTDGQSRYNIIICLKSLYQIIAPGEGVSSSFPPIPLPSVPIHLPTYKTYKPIAIERTEIVESGGASLVSAITTPDGDVLLSEHYTVFYNSYDEPYRILLLAFDAPHS